MNRNILNDAADGAAGTGYVRFQIAMDGEKQSEQLAEHYVERRPVRVRDRNA